MYNLQLALTSNSHDLQFLCTHWERNQMMVQNNKAVHPIHRLQILFVSKFVCSSKNIVSNPICCVLWNFL